MIKSTIIKTNNNVFLSHNILSKAIYNNNNWFISIWINIINSNIKSDYIIFGQNEQSCNNKYNSFFYIKYNYNKDKIQICILQNKRIKYKDYKEIELYSFKIKKNVYNFIIVEVYNDKYLSVYLNDSFITYNSIYDIDNRFINYNSKIPTFKSDCSYLLGYLNKTTKNNINDSLNKESFAILSLGISFKKLKLSLINNNLLKNFNNNTNNLYDIFINFNSILSYKNILFENGYNKEIYNNINYTLCSSLINVSHYDYLSIKDSYINYFNYNIFQLITKSNGLKLNLNSSLYNDFTIDVLFAVDIDNLFNISNNKVVVIALGDRPNNDTYINRINNDPVYSQNEYILVSIVNISKTSITIKIDYNTRYSYTFEYIYSFKVYNEIRIIISNKVLKFNNKSINILSSIRYTNSNIEDNKYNLYIKDFIIDEYHIISNKIELGMNYIVNSNKKINNTQSYKINYRYVKVYNQYIDSLDIINSCKNNNIIDYNLDDNKLSTYYDFSYSSNNMSFFEYISDKEYVITELDTNLQPRIIFKSIEKYCKEQFVNNKTKSLYIPNYNYELTLPLPKIDNSIGRLNKYIILDSFSLEFWFIINKNYINNIDNGLETNIIYNFNINNKTHTFSVVKNIFKLYLIEDKLSFMMKTYNIKDSINITHSLNSIVYNQWNYFSISIPNSLQYNKVISILYNSNVSNSNNNISIHEYHEKSINTVNYQNFSFVLSESNKISISVSNANHKDLYIKTFRLWNNYNRLNFILSNILNNIDSDLYKYLIYNFEYSDNDVYNIEYKDYDILSNLKKDNSNNNNNNNNNNSIKSSIDIYKINTYELKDYNRLFVRHPRIFINKNSYAYNLNTCMKNYSKSLYSEDYNKIIFNNYYNLSICKPTDKANNSNKILGASLTNIKYNLSNKVLIKNEIQFVFWYYNKDRIYDFNDSNLDKFRFISLDYQNISDDNDDTLEIISIRLSDYINNILFVDNKYVIYNNIDNNIYTSLKFWKFAVVSVSTDKNKLLYNNKYFDIPNNYNNSSRYNEYLNNISEDFITINNNKKYYLVINKITKQDESSIINNLTSIYLKSLNIYNKIIDYNELLTNKYNYNINYKYFKLHSSSLIYRNLIFDLFIDKYGELNNIINDNNIIGNTSNIDINVFNNIVNDQIITNTILDKGIIKFDYLSNKEIDIANNKIRKISICNSSFNENYKLDFKDNKCKIYYDKKDNFIKKVLQLNPDKDDYLIKMDINKDIKSKKNFEYPLYINKDKNTIDNYYISFWFKMKCLECLESTLAEIVLLEYNCNSILLDIYSHNQLIINNNNKLNYANKQWIMITIVANDNYNIVLKSNIDNKNIYENLDITNYKLNCSCTINFAKSKTFNNDLNSFFLKDIIIGFYKVHFTFYEYLYNKNINYIDLGIYYYFKLNYLYKVNFNIEVYDEVSKSYMTINKINNNYDINNYSIIDISKDYKEKAPLVNICDDNSFSFNNSCNYINFYKLPFNSNIIIKNVYYNIPFAVELSFKTLINTKSNLGIIQLNFGNVQIKASIEYKKTLSIYHVLFDNYENIVSKFDKYIDISNINNYNNYVLVIGVENNDLYIDYFSTYVKINDMLYSNIYRFRIEDYKLNSRNLEKYKENILSYFSINLLYRNNIYIDDNYETDNFAYLKYLRIYKYTPSNDILTKMANRYIIFQSYTQFYFYIDFRLFVSLDKKYFYDIVSGKTIKDLYKNIDYPLDLHNLILNSNEECSLYSSIYPTSNIVNNINNNHQYKCYVKSYEYCKIGMYYDSYNQTCLNCNSNCRSCFIQPDNCIDCSNNYYLAEYRYNTCYYSKKYFEHYYVSNQSVLLSNNNYYKDIFLMCNSKCFDCTGPSILECSSCKGMKYIDNKGICSEHCIEGQIYDKTQGKCISCSIECKTCEGTYNHCTECASNYVYLAELNQCLDNCSIGYYEYERNCFKCSEQCYSCTLYEDNCTECYNNYYPIKNKKNKCYRYYPPEYPYNYYLNQFNNEYEPCDENCLTCYENSKKCMSCKQYLLEDTCIDKCPDGMYGGLFKIPENIPYYVKNNKRCYFCNKVCDLCYDDSEYCIKCAKGYKKNHYNKCQILCEDGFYVDYEANICRRCNRPCLTCVNNENNCRTCIENYNILKLNSYNNYNYNTCVETCPNKFTKVKNEINECIKCKEECSKCISQDFCTACEEGYYLIIDLGLCVKACPSSYFVEDNSLCTLCPKECKECLNRRHCTSCNLEYFFYPENNSCKSKCIERHFITSNNNCEKCDVNCLNCFEYKDNCILCPEGKTLVVSEEDKTKHKCTYITLNNENADNQSSEAKKCPTNCLECTNNNTCIKCDDTTEYSLLKDNKCISKCNISETYISSINKCIDFKECIIESNIIGPNVIDKNNKNINKSPPNEYHISLSYDEDCKIYKNEIESNIIYSLNSNLIPIGENKHNSKTKDNSNNLDNLYKIYASELSNISNSDIIIQGKIVNKINLEYLNCTELTVKSNSFKINIIIDEDEIIRVGLNDTLNIHAHKSFDEFNFYSNKNNARKLDFKWECLIDGNLNNCDNNPGKKSVFSNKVINLLNNTDKEDTKEFDIKLTVSNNKKESSKIIKIIIDNELRNNRSSIFYDKDDSSSSSKDKKLDVVNDDNTVRVSESNTTNSDVSKVDTTNRRNLFDLRLIEPKPKYLEIDLNSLNIGVNKLTISIKNLKTKEVIYKQIKIVNYERPKYGVCLVDNKLNSYALSVNEIIYFETMFWESVGIIKYSLVFRINKHPFNTNSDTDKLRLDDIPISNYSFNTKFKIENLPINGKIYVKAFDPIANKASITKCDINVSTSLETINIKKLQKILRNLENMTIYYDKLRAILTFFQLIRYNPLLYDNKYLEYCLNEFNRHIHNLNSNINNLYEIDESEKSNEYNNYVNEYIYIQTVFNIVFEFEQYKLALDEDKVLNILETTNAIYNIKIDEILVNFLITSKRDMLLSLIAKSFEKMIKIFNNNYNSIINNKIKFEKYFTKYLVSNYIKLLLLLNDEGTLELRLNRDYLVILKTTYSNKVISNIYDLRNNSLTNNKSITTIKNEYNKCFNYINSIINLDNNYKYYIIDNNIGNKNVINMYFNILISSLKNTKKYNLNSKELDSIAIFGIEIYELHILSYKPEAKEVIKKFKECFLVKNISFNVDIDKDTTDILLAKKNYIINLNLVCLSYNDFNNDINFCITWIDYNNNKIQCNCKNLGIIVVVSNLKTLHDYSLEYQFSIDEMPICKIIYLINIIT